MEFGNLSVCMIYRPIREHSIPSFFANDSVQISQQIYINLNGCHQYFQRHITSSQAKYSHHNLKTK